ncbi:peptidase M48 [Sinirhodobacter populi]|uniref:Peptidase M48 n=1 Tax=Paenirhodobacter populi TaxID=2306993 RepID=A0A443KHL3_9RHOB|nr:M48 family metallopeptidase [Sinirhodobacter populi]RWR32226.1 peptidase M48 [Sinirhodobacter populi]
MQATVIRACLGLLLAAMLGACSVAPRQQVVVPHPAAAPQVSAEAVPARLSTQQAADNFIAVARTMQPKIREECLERTQGRQNCNYRILVDERQSTSPNAFQTVDSQGNPIVAFNLALIAEARNPDELAFVMGHEAAHHILGHLQSKSQDAAAGAMILGVLAAATGADATGISQAQDIGASVGSRAYSKDYELQADRLGTIISWDAGFDPARGVLFFNRLSDPGDQFLGSHPPNAQRVMVVRRTIAQLQAGQI